MSEESLEIEAYIDPTSPLYQVPVSTVVTDERLREYGLPQRSTEGSAGADLRAMLDVEHPQYSDGVIEIHPGQTILISTGIRIHIEDTRLAGFIMARSGLASKRGLAPANKVGLIDSDYQGPLMVALHNSSGGIKTVEQGERIAQLVVVPIANFVLDEIDSFDDETERGEGGFGHTGEQ